MDAQKWDGSYPPPIPASSEGEPAMSDSEALDYLAGTVLGDQASSYGDLVQDAMLTVMRTGRTITPVTGD